MWVTQVYIDGEFIGAGEIGLVRVHDEYHPPKSLAYFCSSCGEIWARIVVDGDPRGWFLYYSLCPRHGLGTIYFKYESEHMGALPRAALEREFLLISEHPGWYGRPYAKRENGLPEPIRMPSGEIIDDGPDDPVDANSLDF